MGRLSDLHGTAIVTGAASGLGLAFSQMLQEEGVRVWGSARDVARLGPASPRFSPLSLDLNEPDRALENFERAAGEAGGSFDLVVNNAGYGIFGEFGEVSAGEWRAQVEAMLGTTLALTQSAWKSMRLRHRGTIVNVSSLAAEFPLPFMSGYNVVKAGLSALSESLIIESRGTAVTVIDFRPGDYRTSFNRAMQSVSPSLSAAPSVQSAWRALEANLAAAPEAGRAASDLKRALVRGQSGIVRSGTFFQAQLAPLFARIAPESLQRWVSARYFGLR